MINVLFFARTRELIGCDRLELDYSGPLTAAELARQLARRGEKWAQALGGGQLLVAINQAMAERHAEIQDGDEVAFFPPVTGG